jgi:N-acetylmuramoyl-L-alanine amidase
MPSTIVKHSRNCSRRPAGAVVDTIVLHCTESTDTQQDVDWLCHSSGNEAASAHDIIDRDGTRYSLVPAEMEAWHAGYSCFLGRYRVNEFSVGIELANNRKAREPYPEAQLEATAWLVVDYMRKFPATTLERITRHSDIAVPAGRKQDPGSLFDMPAFLARVERYQTLNEQGGECEAA